MHEAAIAKMEEEVARGRAQYVAAAAAEAATARAKISDALGRATALEAELCAARTESAAASAALAALQSELQQSTQRPVNDSTETKTEISDGASDVDVQSTSAFDSMEASALASRTPDGADELPESGSIRVEEAHVPTSDEGVASRESSSSRASVDRVSFLSRSSGLVPCCFFFTLLVLEGTYIKSIMVRLVLTFHFGVWCTGSCCCCRS